MNYSPWLIKFIILSQMFSSPMRLNNSNMKFYSICFFFTSFIFYVPIILPLTFLLNFLSLSPWISYLWKDSSWARKPMGNRRKMRYILFLLTFSKQDRGISLFLVLSLKYHVWSLATKPIHVVVLSLLIRVMTACNGSVEFDPLCCKAVWNSSKTGCRNNAYLQIMDNSNLFLSETLSL